jgi:serine/threonine protein kinase
MLSQVALGLASAHASKVVHRDLKPDNIFLCGTHEGDIVKILDFGSVRDNSENAKKLTVMGTTIGSPFYMAPEQAQGLPSLDHRADVWSLAAIAYECLTGTVPFRGATGPAILLAILTQEPVPPSEVRAHQQVPVTLDPVMEEALTKDPDIRIKTISELAERVGHAFGLSGTHVEWAATPQEALRERIQSGLPAMLAAHKAKEAPPAVDLARMDQAMVVGRPPPLSSFSEDVVMGVPASSTPGWVVAAALGAFVVVGAIVAFLRPHLTPS